MHNYSIRTTVNRQEATALKEMIFNRVRERAENLTDEVNSTYTTTTQFEVMDLARASFVAERNPFTINQPKVEEKELKAEENKAEVPVNQAVKEKREGLGFPERRVLSRGIQTTVNSVNEEVVNSTISSSMNDARRELSSKPLFAGALNFLNTQASIELSNSKKKSFEAFA